MTGELAPIFWCAFASFVVSLGGIPIYRAGRAWLQSKQSLGWRWLIWLPILSPDVIVGYCYSYLTLWLGLNSWGSEFFYRFLSALKFWPWGVLVAGDEGALNREGAFLLKQVPAKTFSSWCRIHLLGKFWGEYQTILPSLAVVWILGFQDFELAARLGSSSWMVQSFDAHAQGLAIWESINSIQIPCLIQFGVLVVFRLSWRPSLTIPQSLPGGRLFWPFLTLALLLITVWPSKVLLSGLIQGGSLVLSDFTRIRGLVEGTIWTFFTAFLCGLLTFEFVDRILSRGMGSRKSEFLMSLLLLPGLSGGLTIGLLILLMARALMGETNSEGTEILLLESLVRSPLPLIFGTILWLIPRAYLLRLALTPHRNESVHSATLQGRAGRGVLWELEIKRRFGQVLLLTSMVYFELTLHSLLAPVGIVSPIVTVYNLMHYGESVTLSATVTLALILPGLLFVALWFVRRLVWHLVGI